MNKRNASRRGERLLDAAADLIARLGYDKTTISDIASQAGVAKGAVYLHWTSKDDLFEALIIREMRRMMDDVLARVEADPRGGSLTRMYTHALLALQANPLMRALYTRDSRVLGDYMRHQVPARYIERFWFGKVFIETMQAAGLVRQEVNPESLAYVLSIIAYGFTSIETIIPAAQAPPVEEVASALEVLMAHGIALEDGDIEAGKRALRQGVAVINRQYQAISDGQPDQSKKA
jgi:AcrR family transcriptional regulator